MPGNDYPERVAAVNGSKTNALRRSRHGIAVCAVLAAALGVSGAVFAQHRQPILQPDGEPPVTAFAAQRGGVSLGQDTAMARGRYPGRVVRAEQVMIGDRVVYEIRILGDDGRVRTVRVDAQTGSFM